MVPFLYNAMKRPDT